MNPNVAQTTSAPAASALPSAAGLEVALATDPGRDPNKQVNEDSAFARETAHGYLAVVCDGMGGHVGGKEASALAIETIFGTFDRAPAGTAPQELLGEAIRQANRAVFDKGGANPDLKGMGSTCVAVLHHRNTPAGSALEVAHVGDSRCYLLTQGQVYQVTKDHSLVQRLVDANMLTPEEASTHPSANQITNALGMRPDVEVEVRPQPLTPQPGDTFVLCSDGLSDEVGPQDILQILLPMPTCEAAGRQLVDLANARGGHDNITVVLVRFPGGTAGGGSSTRHTPVAMPAVGPGPTMEMAVVPNPNPGAVPTFSPMPPPPVMPGASPPAQRAHVGNADNRGPDYGSVPTPLEQPRKKGGKGIVIAVVLVLLLLAAAAAATLYYRSTQEKAQPSTKDTVEVPEPPASKPSASTKPKPVVTQEPEPEPTTSTAPSHSSLHPPKPLDGATGPVPPPPPSLPPDQVKTPDSAPKTKPSAGGSGNPWVKDG